MVERKTSKMSVGRGKGSQLANKTVTITEDGEGDTAERAVENQDG